MKVLHIGEYVRGGVATYVRTLLADNNYKVENYLVLADDKSEKKWPLDEKHIIYYKFRRNWRCIIPAVWKIKKIIEKINPDIIYVHSTWAGVMVRIPYLLKKRTMKIIYNPHGWSFLMDVSSYKQKTYVFIERILAYATDVIINVSMKEYNTAKKMKISPHKQKVIYSGISNKLGLVDDSIVKNKFAKEKINLLFVGRFDRQKGVDLLINAINECEREDIHLTLIGDNVVSSQEYIKKEDTDRLTFLGWIPHEEIASYYMGCDAVIMPSRWEAFGLVAIEAMKYGKPVIASNRGALPEIINKKELGYIFDLDKPNELVLLFNKLSKNSLKTMHDVVKKEFQKYTAENMLGKTYLLYRNDKAADG